MYVSMGHMIGLPLGSVFHGGGWHAILFAGTQLALTLPVCWINRAFFISGWKGIKTRAPGMDTLVALGAGASLAYGLFAIVMICVGLYTGNDDLVMQYRHDLYFESAAMILTLITVGKTLEAYSKGKTTDALKSLMKLAPQTACVLRDGEQVTVPVSEVHVGGQVSRLACQRRHHQPERCPDLPPSASARTRRCPRSSVWCATLPLPRPRLPRRPIKFLASSFPPSSALPPQRS